VKIACLRQRLEYEEIQRALQVVFCQNYTPSELCMRLGYP
jgi:hypothetical protein